jgi:RND superfamily putative drug exporter
VDSLPPVPLLRRVGSSCARHPLRVVGAWLLVLAAVVAVSHAAGGVYSDNVNLAGTEADTARTLLAAHDPAAGGYLGQVVLRAPTGTVNDLSAQVSQTVGNLSKLPDVISVTNPLSSGAVSPGGTIAYITMHLSVLPKTLGAPYVADLHQATRPLTDAHAQVEYGGQFDALTRPKAKDGRSELVGFGVALVVLLAGFGSLAAAALPLLTALVATLVGLQLLGIVAAVLTFGTASPTLALMIGLGVGIDYALFLTTRHRQRVIDGVDPVVAAGEAVSTSGRAVLVAATTVSIALLGLFASGITFLGMLGFAAVFGVVCAAAGAVTLVPAALGLLGRNIDRVRVTRRPVAETGRDGDWWHRYAAGVGRRPWLFLAAGIVILGVLAVPLFSIRLGHVDDGADPASYTDKRAYDLIAQGFGPGANGPFTIVVQLPAGTPATSSSGQALAQKVGSALASTPGVAHTTPLQPTKDGALLVGNAVPTTSPQAAATTSLFHHLYDTTLPSALQGSGAKGYVTGATASYIEFAASLAATLPIIIAVVVACAFLLIMTAFRSLLLAVKAAVLNLISISAAYGVIVAVFQWGWGRQLLGVSGTVPIESYVPVFMFAIVFGLSMDYEIFLLSRVKEHWDETGDQHLAVARGLSSTGRVITCAALIMASVFLAFVASGDVVIKQLAVGLSASVVLDATIVRLLLVPAVMYLLGRSSWWLPGWLDRLLPHLDVEPAAPDSALPGGVPAGAASA